MARFRFPCLGMGSAARLTGSPTARGIHLLAFGICSPVSPVIGHGKLKVERVMFRSWGVVVQLLLVSVIAIADG